MTDNPYVPPSSPTESEPAESARRHRFTRRVAVLGFICIMAGLCGIGWCFAGANSSPVFNFLALWPPGIALFVTGFAGMFPSSRLKAAHFGSVIAKVVLALLLGAAGCAAFVATCCTTTINLEGARYPNWVGEGDGSLAPPLVLGVIAFFSTLVGCAVVSLLSLGLRRIATHFFAKSE